MVANDVSAKNSAKQKSATDPVQRRSEIIRTVVDEYVKTNEPVGSAHVARASKFLASSSTIRNDMAVLEQEGYLNQPHVSSGRIPTDRGYRYYVDQLVQRELQSFEKVSDINRFFQVLHGEIEQTLTSVSQLISELTDCTSIVTSIDITAVQIRHIQLVGMGHGTVLLIVVGSNGSVDKVVVDVDDDPTEQEVQKASNFINQRLKSLDLGKLEGDQDASGDPKVDELVSLALGALAQNLQEPHEDLWVNATSKVAVSFDAVDKVSKVLQALEHEYLVVSLVRSMISKKQNVSIGNETGVESLSDCALVVAPFEVDGKRAGSIGILGPTRMDYPLALSTVSLVGEKLGRYLSEG